ncbi:ribonuclease T2 Ecym_8306 [Eremothecium cymbalariae DBVPG|uniref:ribonuclease T2 n=1 Tax=Eremothecium cymbalariae (strain CBS 270.75 / DBVPG 7215 / KCTC 17166 / NRRL Y-17582) TaxID=931890 RepID=G8JXL0_ERECY|nr:Hypothetical protein Ecym_8306 [Eremothecium cymbalariae DBVPG\
MTRLVRLLELVGLVAVSLLKVNGEQMVLSNDNHAREKKVVTADRQSSRVVFGGPSCPTDIPYSCRKGAEHQVDSCCYEATGGLFLLTQLWQYDDSSPYLRYGRKREENRGPKDAFTVHGLWGDRCDGSYDQFCNPQLAVKGVTEVLEQAGLNDGSLPVSGEELLKEMRKWWPSTKGSVDEFWSHEYNKHGLCMSTLLPQCFQDGKAAGGSHIASQELSVYNYFRVAMNLFKRYDTFAVLRKHGIVPSCTRTYKLQEIKAALRNVFGVDVEVRCDNKHAISEVWYFHILKGSVLGEQFLLLDSASASNCPSSGIRWYPKP